MKKIILFLIIVIAIVAIYMEVKPNENNSSHANMQANAETEKTTNIASHTEQTTKQIKKEYNVLVIGNSITLEKAGIGMAASDQYHDYYYLTKSKLEQTYEKVNMNRVSAIKWEENRIISSRTDWINENLPQELVSNLDLVIFQLGDNCVPTETFEESATELVQHVKKYSPEAKMLWLGMWFINEERLNMLPGICEKLDVEFINISDLVVDEYKSYIGAPVTSINGENMQISTIEEAFHPNDEGMKMISNRIIEALGL